MTHSGLESMDVDIPNVACAIQSMIHSGLESTGPVGIPNMAFDWVSCTRNTRHADAGGGSMLRRHV